MEAETDRENELIEFSKLTLDIDKFIEFHIEMKNEKVKLQEDYNQLSNDFDKLSNAFSIIELENLKLRQKMLVEIIYAKLYFFQCNQLNIFILLLNIILCFFSWT